jgi:hypothetical protein
MTPLISAVPTLAVGLIFSLWDVWRRQRLQREATLRRRVAYMLWAMAERL